MKPSLPRSLRVEDSSHVGSARRLATALCAELGFCDAATAPVALVATELATNLVKHTAGAGGELVWQPVEDSGRRGIELLALDRGPGMANVAACLRDGHSTAGSAGIGLGAVRRLSAQFDIHSAPGQGTALWSRLWNGAAPSPSPSPSQGLQIGAVCLPLRGEAACGDAWAVQAGPGSTRILVADGLGHGPDAAAAAARAVALFAAPLQRSPAEWLHALHAGLRGSRGAAVAVAELVHGTNGMTGMTGTTGTTGPTGPTELRFAGVGNVCALLLAADGSTRRLVSHNGTAGVEARTVQQFSCPWPAGSLLVLHSDGLATHWKMTDWPGLTQRHPALIAGVLYRDHQRPRDDSTVLVVKAAPRAAEPTP